MRMSRRADDKMRKIDVEHKISKAGGWIAQFKKACGGGSGFPSPLP